MLQCVLFNKKNQEVTTHTFGAATHFLNSTSHTPYFFLFPTGTETNIRRSCAYARYSAHFEIGAKGIYIYFTYIYVIYVLYKYVCESVLGAAVHMPTTVPFLNLVP